MVIECYANVSNVDNVKVQATSWQAEGKKWNSGVILKVVSSDS